MSTSSLACCKAAAPGRCQSRRGENRADQRAPMVGPFSAWRIAQNVFDAVPRPGIAGVNPAGFRMSVSASATPRATPALRTP